jgi:hypothetical protein
MPHANNRILGRLSPADLENLRPHFRLVELEHGRVIVRSGERIDHVYFPHVEILSSVVELEDGSTIESGMIGNDGVFGATQALDDTVPAQGCGAGARPGHRRGRGPPSSGYALLP